MAATDLLRRDGVALKADDKTLILIFFRVPRTIQSGGAQTIDSDRDDYAHGGGHEPN